MNIVLIGAGNVATHLGSALIASGHKILQLYSRTEESATALSELLNVTRTTSVDEILTDADLYVVSVKDSVLDEFLPRLVSRNKEALWVHTSGTIPMQIWESTSALRYGVLYPMQTFSKHKPVDFQQIPLFVESNNPSDTELLMSLASSLSRNVHEASSEQRRALHIAAVFVCNFTNAMYAAAARLLENNGLSFETMLPLIDETAAKVHSLSPHEAQTGPAVRNDHNVMAKHLQMLDCYPAEKEIYERISQMIYENRLR